MSVGVDFCNAALMKQEGYDVIGVTLKLYDDLKQSKEGRQCWCWTRYNGCQKRSEK